MATVSAEYTVTVTQKKCGMAQRGYTCRMAESVGRHFPHRLKRVSPLRAFQDARWASLLSPGGFPPLKILLGLLSYRNYMNDVSYFIESGWDV